MGTGVGQYVGVQAAAYDEKLDAVDRSLREVPIRELVELADVVPPFGEQVRHRLDVVDAGGLPEGQMATEIRRCADEGEAGV